MGRAGCSRWGNGGAGRVGWAAGVAGREEQGGGGWQAGWGRVGWRAWLGVGLVGRRVGWYGPVAANLYTVQKVVCNGGVKNELLAG